MLHGRGGCDGGVGDGVAGEVTGGLDRRVTGDRQAQVTVQPPPPLP